MTRLIDADELEKNLSNDLPYKGSVKRVLIQAPTVDAVSRALHEWIKWERDMAVSQLNDYGVQLGEKADCVRVVRCKDCYHFEPFDCPDGWGICKLHNDSEWHGNDHCSYGYE